jgi:hypothetical protein
LQQHLTGIPTNAPQQPPLQHLTGFPPQQYPSTTAATPAHASGTPSLDEQLTKLQLYRQQQQMIPQHTGFITQYQTSPQGYVNGLVQPLPIQPQTTGYMPNFFPPTQQNPQLGPQRSISTSLAPPLIPAPNAQFLSSHRTGPANFGPNPTQFQPLQPPTGSGPYPQQTIPLQTQMTGFQPPPTQPVIPQPTGYGQPQGLPPQMLAPQKAGMEFKPVSFGTTPKPLVPSRTGKRANLAAASISPFWNIVDSSTGESVRILEFDAGGGNLACMKTATLQFILF